ncbi:hypothetical protein GCM10027569_19810 [Flindersiella endophytica]
MDDLVGDDVANSGSPRRVEEPPRAVDLDGDGVAALIRNGGEVHDRVRLAYGRGEPIAGGQVGAYPCDRTVGERRPAARRPYRVAGLHQSRQQRCAEPPARAGDEHGAGSVVVHAGVDGWAGEFVTSR